MTGQVLGCAAGRGGPRVRCRQGRTCAPEAVTVGHSGNMPSPRRRRWACPGVPRPRMDMSFEPGAASGHVLGRAAEEERTCPPEAMTGGHSGNMPSPRSRRWACPGVPRTGRDVSIATGRNGACPADHPGRGFQAAPAALRKCRRLDAWRAPARPTVVRRSYAPVTVASFEAMPRMTSGACSAASQSAGRHRSP